ncbi:MAG: S8 family serine peptidase [Gemmatimonadetes bacterium]|nr:S8 family serine peptidase [Gemmatimonadota bacterium]
METAAIALASRTPVIATLVVAGALLACAEEPTTPLLPNRLAASLPLEGDVRPDTIHNRYVVVLRRDVPSAAAASAALVAQFGGLRFYVYETALKGFAVVNLLDGAVEALRSHPLVTLVEEDKLMMPAQSVQHFSSPQDTGLYLLDRIDQRVRPLDWQYVYGATGQEVHLYIVDSGVRGGHQEWTYSRIGNSAAFIKWSWDPSPTIDQLGHGTAVAGAAAGSRIGVAKAATIHSVRIDDGDRGAYESDIIAGLDWVAANYIRPAVTNLSYDQNSGAIASAITGVVNQGITFVTVAGNGNGADACNPSTRVATVITVGATTVNDYRASYSNIGPCVDLFAPGGGVYGYHNGYGLLELASNAGNEDYRFSSGTSFASPVAAGVAALILDQRPSLSPVGVANLMVDSATENVISDAGTGSPNLLLFSRIEIPPPAPGSLRVTIDGPEYVRREQVCTWVAVAGGGAAPYRYTWYRNHTTMVGEDVSYTGSLDPWEGWFDLTVLVYDANGASESHTIRVGEDPAAADCLQ